MVTGFFIGAPSYLPGGGGRMMMVGDCIFGGGPARVLGQGTTDRDRTEQEEALAELLTNSTRKESLGNPLGKPVVWLTGVMVRLLDKRTAAELLPNKLVREQLGLLSELLVKTTITNELPAVGGNCLPLGVTVTFSAVKAATKLLAKKVMFVLLLGKVEVTFSANRVATKLLAKMVTFKLLVPLPGAGSSGKQMVWTGVTTGGGVVALIGGGVVVTGGKVDVTFEATVVVV